MDKLKMHSLDGVARNIELIGNLFPNAVTEVMRDGKVERAIDFDVLRQELSDCIVEGREERYQFTWPDKKKAMLAANAPITATLRPVVADSVGKDGTPGGFDSENLYIEGDNLEVLKLLQETYLGKVKMIYIDPPYNTGNDFVYEDDFAQSTGEYMENSGQYDEAGNRMVTNTESNGRFHTDWLNMMYPRLKIAKDLLTEDGVIFISIDDNEIENMKKLCDEVYGATSFVAQLVWEKKKKGSFLSKSITNVKEYVLVYCKNIDSFKGLIGEINDEEETYPCINAVNKRELRTIPAGIESKYRDKDFFMPKGSEISDTTMSIVLHSDLVIKNGILAEELTLEGNWRYSQPAMREYALKKELYITRDLYLRRIVRETRYKTKEILGAIDRAIDSSIQLRSKKDLIQGFIETVNASTVVDRDWRIYVEKQKEQDLDQIIAEEKLKPDEAKHFIDNSFRDGTLKTTGTDFDRIMPPVSRFGGGSRTEKKQGIIRRLSGFFEKYLGVA